jgi:DNA-binding NarL/FixJ family response regulator
MEAIRVVLAHEHPITGAGVHILEEVRHLFDDLAPDLLVIEMTLAEESTPPLREPPASGAAPPRVLVLRGHHSHIQVFALLSGEAEVGLPEQAALQMIADSIRAGLSGGISHQRIIAKLPTQQLAAETTAPALTPRERDVLRELATGKSDQDIARQLGISAWTVRYHLKHIYHKLNVRRRSEAVAWVMETRWER